MALVTFIETTSSKLDSLPIVEGRFTFTTDDKKLYRDTAEEHAAIGGSSIFMTVDSGIWTIVTNASDVDIAVNDTATSLVFTVS